MFLLILLLDSFVIYNKVIVFIGFDYLSLEIFIKKVIEIFKEEGIIVVDGGLYVVSVKFVFLEYLGKVVVFVSSDEIIDCVVFWCKEFDKFVVGVE